ncbi:hypothetical protein GNY06_06485 [Elizabethkingia argentiflava]|uniref:Uncharacterized protein n=1 Tax=Elizabethkingia argenteiflava TaxID=2681556 RepID=A0A845PS40_9FLAO|nr:hypothetical protein [Elizabethkingia argenteiflava]NAW51032.1 hypothetical protein [Elizabethkingia argenteiflava]
MKLKLSLAILFLLQLTCMAQSKLSSDKLTSKDYLDLALEKVNTAKSENDLQNSINEIKRIEGLDKNYWLPSYYVSYFELTQSFFTSLDKKEALLADAKERIEKLLEDKSSDQSELYTILGYYYYAKIAQNPHKNGPIYYKDVIANYKKAISINPVNPRPRYLLDLFEDNVNSFMGKKDSNLCEKLQKDKKLFEAFNIADKNYPNWGEKEVLEHLKNCDKG